MRLTFGERLADLRQAHGKKQRDLADYLNVTLKTIGNYESGRTMPPLSRIEKLANYFQVTTDYLLGNADYNALPDLHAYYAKYNKQEYSVGKVLEYLLALDNDSRTALLIFLVEEVKEYAQLDNAQQKQVHAYIQGLLGK